MAMVVAVPIFAFIFITLYRPFDFDNLDNSILRGLNISRELAIQFITLLLVFVGTIVAAVSRSVMGLYTRKRQLSYTQYVAWIALEIVFMALIYTIAALFTETDKDIVTLFHNSLVKTTLIIAIPYAIFYIIFILIEQSKQLRKLKLRIQSEDAAQLQAYIQIFDEKGEMRLSVRRDTILLLESADNYVCVWYSNNGVPKKSLVRNTMKRVAEQLEGSGIMRCHRSYMVNLDHMSILRREKEGVFIELDIDNVPDIPISKSYAHNIQEWLVGKSN